MRSVITSGDIAASANVAASGNDAASTIAESLYREIGLAGQMDSAAFNAGYRRFAKEGVRSGMVAIADMTKPSIEKRLFLIDLDSKKVVLRTYVAHGSNTGDLYATKFSDKFNSHQTSLGLYRVGATITSPKHGAALLLNGLDKGLNGLARAREVIIHGADYVSEKFIAARGRLGRSWGCPAVPRDDMPTVIRSLAGGGLLYVYGG